MCFLRRRLRLFESLCVLGNVEHANMQVKGSQEAGLFFYRLRLICFGDQAGRGTSYYRAKVM